MSMKDQAKNLAQVSKGKMKEAVSGATGDDHLETEGVVDQMKGNLKQAGEKVTDALKK